jgi:hypothetical protein
MSARMAELVDALVSNTWETVPVRLTWVFKTASFEGFLVL